MVCRSAPRRPLPSSDLFYDHDLSHHCGSLSLVPCLSPGQRNSPTRSFRRVVKEVEDGCGRQRGVWERRSLLAHHRQSCHRRLRQDRTGTPRAILHSCGVSLWGGQPTHNTCGRRKCPHSTISLPLLRCWRKTTRRYWEISGQWRGISRPAGSRSRLSLTHCTSP